MFNKKALTPRYWIIVVVFISLIITMSATWLNEWETAYGYNDTVTNLSGYSQLTEMAVQTEGLQSQLSSDDEIASLGFLDFIVKGAYNVLIAIIEIPSTIEPFIRDMASEIGVPPFMVTALLVLISVSLIFGILGTIFRRKT